MSEEKTVLNVGLVMPIATIESCGPEHWLEVKSIVAEALANHEKYQFETKIVSESDSSGLIHKRIVQGLYNSDIVICDVSCKNPNVMFELGMRLAFDKPTIIIKDDKTNFSFDTSGIEHIEYPRDLRFAKIVDFKSTLVRKVLATFEDSINDPNHSTFLKSFGEFKVAKLQETEVTPSDLILDKLSEMQSDINNLKKSRYRTYRTDTDNYRNDNTRFRLKPEVYDHFYEGVKRYFETSDPAGINRKDSISFVSRYLLDIKSPAARLSESMIAMCVEEIGKEFGIPA